VPEDVGAAQRSAAALVGTMPLAELLGVEAISAGPEEVRGRLPWRQEVCTTGGVMHGGALMALADSLGAVCAFFNLPEGATTSTIESKTNFFRAVRGGAAEAVARPLHVGRTTIVIQTDVFDSEGRRVAQVTQTQAVLGRPP
jgi:1,4-dihydroxy-2-naphthoyl-CoA hydrolase